MDWSENKRKKKTIQQSSTMAAQDRKVPARGLIEYFLFIDGQIANQAFAMLTAERCASGDNKP